MIVLGVDTHKSSHTLAAVDSQVSQVLEDKTIQVGARGFSALLIWARSLDGERSGRWRTAGMSRARWNGF
jgi:hypothetical protein